MGANILGFNGVVLSVGGDVPVDTEVVMVTSSIISKICQPVFKNAHKDKICVCAFIGVSVRAVRVSELYCMKKNTTFLM